jgi:hypothetical protein
LDRVIRSRRQRQQKKLPRKPAGMADCMSRMCRPALEHRSFTDSSAVAELRRTTRAGAAFHHEFTGRGRGGGPFSFRYECNRITRDERATVRGCGVRQLSSRTCRTPPLPAARRFRKLSIIEQGVHQAEHNPGNERFHVRKGTRQPRSRGIMAGDLAGPTACINCTLPFFRRAVVTPKPDLAPTIR